MYNEEFFRKGLKGFYNKQLIQNFWLWIHISLQSRVPLITKCNLEEYATPGLHAKRMHLQTEQLKYSFSKNYIW